MANKKIKGITIQIGADTTGLDTALNGIEKKSKGTKSELAEVNRALKKAPESTELWKQKQELLAKAIQDSRDKVKLLEDAQEQVNQQFKDSKIGEEQYRAFQRELEYAKAEVGRFEGELESLNRTAGSTSEDVKNLGDSAEDAGEKAEKSGDGFTVLKGALAHLVYEGIEKAVGAFKDFAEEAMVFNDSIAKVSTIADATVPIAELQDSIVELSNQTGISSSEIAENVYNAISAGQETADSVNFVENATKLARAGFAETGNALDILSTIMNAYGMEASEVTRVSDVLIQTQNLGKTTVAELSSAMGKVIPTANAYGVSLEQLAAGYAIMTANGVATAESTTYMNSMLNELGKSGTGVSNILKEETGKSFKELSDSGMSLSEVLSIIDEAAQGQNKAFSDMWSSSEAGKAGLILLGDSAENFNQTLGKMQSASGATETAFSKLNTESFELQKAQNQLKNASIELGKEVLKDLTPIAEKILPKIENGVDWITDNLPEIKDEAKKLIPLITTAGSAFSAWKVASVALKGTDAIKKFSSSVSAGNSVMKALNITMSANPAVAVTAGIVGLTAAIVALSIAHDNEKTIADKIADSYKEERKKVDETRDSINKLKDDFSSRAGEIDAESQRTEALWKELDKLTSATGRVRDVDKDRAQYILGELNEALGTEYSMTGNQIDNYNKLATSIEETIEKKKALAYLDAYESKAGEMAELKVTSLENYQKYYADWQTAKAEMDAAAAEFKQKSGYDITGVSYENAEAYGYGDIFKRYETARATANENASLYQESKANYQSAVDYFTRLNDAEKAYADNAYSDIEGILYAQKDATKAVLEDAKAADKEKEDALKKSISNSTIALKAAVETQSQAEIDAAFSTMEEMVRLAKEQNIDISQSFTEDFTKQVTEMIDAGFDISGLTKWGKESGIDVSKVFGKNYTKTVQDQLDKGYDITDLLAWGAASGIDISTEYAGQYYQNVQNQLDQGYDITELLKWGAASGFDISKLFTEEFRDEFMNTLNDEQLGFYQWVLDNEETFRKMGHDLGWAFGDGFSSAYTQYIYSENNLIQSTVNSASDAKLRYNGKYATGGYISSGNTAVVAESGPELLEIMNGGVRVTPLTGAARNTAVGAETAEQRTVLINNTIHVGKISNDYDVKTLAQSLAEEQRRIESGRGQR